MARFRRAKDLTCFYCGKRSGIKFDGAIRDFLCLHCDATNYLDENGEITDPRVATEHEAVTVQYAAPQPLAPLQTKDIFCQTCLKNQHLFTKSLAQYFPDDPSDPDYPELERSYYRYRRNLEKRYPQVCSNCAHRAEERIREAGYTAKTDHLRRMMSLSRGRRTRTRTALDWVNTLGKTLWRTGFILQMLWHFAMATQALQQSDDGMHDPDQQSLHATGIAWLNLAVDFLPAAATLIQSSIWIAILAVWWNPHFVQVNRGFTRHLLGLTQWYSFQGLIIFFRFIFRDVVDAHAQSTDSGTAKLGAHVAMVMVTTVIYVLGGRSIRVDTSPLFATEDRPLISREVESATQRRTDDSKTFSELVNDALDSANTTPQKSIMIDQAPSPQQSFSPSGPDFGKTRPTETPTKRTQQLQYDEEMDWSPIIPQHRALTDSQASLTSKFGPTNGGHSPLPEAKSPFWCKVPAAPVNPAQRLRNPVWSPAPKREPPETGKVMFTRRGHQPTSSPVTVGSDLKGGVEFKQPRFFAPQKDHDASSLADLLSQSFTLGQDQQETAEIAAEQSGSTTMVKRSSQFTIQHSLESTVVTVLLLIDRCGNHSLLRLTIYNLPAARRALLFDLCTVIFQACTHGTSDYGSQLTMAAVGACIAPQIAAGDTAGLVGASLLALSDAMRNCAATGSPGALLSAPRSPAGFPTAIPLEGLAEVGTPPVTSETGSMRRSMFMCSPSG
ncbi:uncharacterized protein MAM_06548 [Metarhizium album ARSEF 1941]|uniref:Ima1 N-terminal domain-containing protein n=1 Tax=Metarhizium album (strain ARSEF 1941) TaxID=1081103 RepID=A0A0B2WHJ0_METAS|nr:uncharacterized protein MAM_06548 [Metarhizium album ARSEF 1941]KHN95491.1 hypothetical protein MAM_06548 [Metarhizium album ARSEF 1941]